MQGLYPSYVLLVIEAVYPFMVIHWFAELCSLTNFQVNQIFAKNAFDAVMHFAAVAYVGESTLDPLRSASLVFLEISCLCLSLTHDNLKTFLGPTGTLLSSFCTL